jgi:NarL family two-component system sensor histidine kinase LiaS
MKKQRSRFGSLMWNTIIEMVFYGCVLFCFFIAMVIVTGKGSWLIAHYVFFFFAFLCICLWSVLYGVWRSVTMIRRIVALQDAVGLLEQGQFPRAFPLMEDDEIGQLTHRIVNLARAWEEQVARLHRLVADNARLAKAEQTSALVSERQRIARDLHDAVSQQLFAIAMCAEALSRRGADEETRNQSTLIANMASLAQSEMRALLMQLRPVPLADHRFVDALHQLLAAHQHNIHVTWDVDETMQLERGIEDHLFRIAQEASNIVRHAQARNVTVHFQRHHTGVRLTISDDGIGFDVHEPKTTSYGLLSMQERVHEIGGSLRIRTFPQQGTKVDVHIPLTPNLYVQQQEGDPPQ